MFQGGDSDSKSPCGAFDSLRGRHNASRMSLLRQQIEEPRSSLVRSIQQRCGTRIAIVCGHKSIHVGRASNRAEANKCIDIDRALVVAEMVTEALIRRAQSTARVLVPRRAV